MLDACSSGWLQVQLNKQHFFFEGVGGLRVKLKHKGNPKNLAALFITSTFLSTTTDVSEGLRNVIHWCKTLKILVSLHIKQLLKASDCAASPLSDSSGKACMSFFAIPSLVYI